MSFFFLDTSAVVKCYIQETGSAWMQSLLSSQENNTIVIAEITMVETAAAIAARHRALGGISRQERDYIFDLFIGECDDMFEIIPTTRPIIEHAANLTQIHHLRGFDAVQLATALSAYEHATAVHLSDLTFVTADYRLITAAQAESLAVENPNDYQ